MCAETTPDQFMPEIKIWKQPNRLPGYSGGERGRTRARETNGRWIEKMGDCVRVRENRRQRERYRNRERQRQIQTQGQRDRGRDKERVGEIE